MVRNPLVTFILFCYRQEKYVREAVRSVLAQDYEPLEILISDDASTDRTYDIVKAEVDRYDGPNEVVLNRNRHNLGGNEHLNLLMGRVRGELVINGGGDDLFAPHRASAIVRCWRETGAYAIASNAQKIDAAGRAKGLRLAPGKVQNMSLELFCRLGANACCYGATLAWHREVFDRFGPIEVGKSPYNADHVIPFRGVLLGGNAYIDEPLVRHRLHPQSDTFRVLNNETKEMMEESYWAHNTTQRLYLLDTLVRFRNRTPDDARLAGAQDSLLKLIFSSTENWVRRRNEFYLNGYRDIWTRAQAG